MRISISFRTFENFVWIENYDFLKQVYNTKMANFRYWHPYPRSSNDIILLELPINDDPDPV